jgi:hypothetical protein
VSPPPPFPRLPFVQDEAELTILQVSPELDEPLLDVVLLEGSPGLAVDDVGKLSRGRAACPGPPLRPRGLAVARHQRREEGVQLRARWGLEQVDDAGALPAEGRGQCVINGVGQALGRDVIPPHVVGERDWIGSKLAAIKWPGSIGRRLVVERKTGSFRPAPSEAQARAMRRLFPLPLRSPPQPECKSRVTVSLAFLASIDTGRRLCGGRPMRSRVWRSRRRSQSTWRKVALLRRNNQPMPLESVALTPNCAEYEAGWLPAVLLSPVDSDGRRDALEEQRWISITATTARHGTAHHSHQ